MPLHRRALLAAAASLPVARPLRAQARPVRVVVPFAAGGAADSAARTILPRMGERLATPSWWRTAPAPAGRSAAPSGARGTGRHPRCCGTRRRTS